MAMVTDSSRQLIIEALRAKAEAGERALLRHEESECPGEDCEWDFPDIIAAGAVDGVVESVYAEPEALVDFILECVEQWCQV